MVVNPPHPVGKSSTTEVFGSRAVTPLFATRHSTPITVKVTNQFSSEVRPRRDRTRNLGRWFCGYDRLSNRQPVLLDAARSSCIVGFMVIIDLKKKPPPALTSWPGGRSDRNPHVGPCLAVF